MKRIGGIVASHGIAIAPLFVYRPPTLNYQRGVVSNAEEECARYAEAIGRVRSDLEAIIDRAGAESENAEIFGIQIEFLEDPTFGEAIGELIAAESINAEWAVERILKELVEEFSAIEDEYFAQRTTDIQDLAARLTRSLLGVANVSLGEVSTPSIVFAHDLTPSDTAEINRNNVLALCTEIGSATSHTAIISRGLGLPAVVGLGEVELETGTPAILDALTGALILEPTPEVREEYLVTKERFDERREILLSRAKELARTLDGVSVEIAANIGNLGDARQAIEFGAEGVGLLRTEFLFLDRTRLPDEEEQYTNYRGIFDVFGMQPVVVRTLDVGGDKNLPSVHIAPEQNPFLGQRAIRLALADPERLLYPQLRALLRASVHRNVKIMFPMVATIPELLNLRAAVDRCRDALAAEGTAYAENVEIGIMVEIPSTAVRAAAFAPYVDFFSIGTNDLTQYTLAVDRTNEQVAPLADYFDPAVLQLIATVINAGHAAGKWVGMCGEMAGDPLAIPILLGLGLDEFSMSPAAIPEAKETLRALSRDSVQPIAQRALTAATAAEARQIAKSGLP
jgi:phosphotransferase system enzyme I (PtsI)